MSGDSLTGIPFSANLPVLHILQMRTWPNIGIQVIQPIVIPMIDLKVIGRIQDKPMKKYKPALSRFVIVWGLDIVGILLL